MAEIPNRPMIYNRRKLPPTGKIFLMMIQQSIDAGAFELATVHEAGAFDCSMQLSDFLRDVPNEALSASDTTVQGITTLRLRARAPSLPFPPPSRFQRDTRSRST